MATNPSAFVPAALGLVAATPVAGFAKQNATPTILTWTAPNDGNQHRFIVFASQTVSTTETGGAISTSETAPGGGVQTGAGNLFAGAKNAGTYHQIDGAIVEAGTTVTVSQTTALSLGGPTTVWAEIWGS